MKKAVIIIALLVAVSVYVYFAHIRPAREYDPTVRASGAIEATTFIVSPKIPARIIGISVDEGDHVKAGQSLISLDCDELQARKRQAEAQRNTAKAGSLQAKANYAQAKSQLGPLKVQQALAEKQHARMLTLYKSNSIPEQSYDQAKAALDTVTEQLAAAQKGIEVARQVIDVAESQIALAAESVDVIDANLVECEVHAPGDGVVMSRNYEPGEMAFPGASLLKIGQLAVVHTWLYVPNEEIGRLRLNQEVRFKADTYPDRTFTGTIVRINDQAEFTPKSIQTKEDRTRLVFGVKVQIDNGDGALSPGMPVEAWVPETAPAIAADGPTEN
jgi:HlyD family secretion protein